MYLSNGSIILEKIHLKRICSLRIQKNCTCQLNRTVVYFCKKVQCYPPTAETLTSSDPATVVAGKVKFTVFVKLVRPSARSMRTGTLYSLGTPSTWINIRTRSVREKKVIIKNSGVCWLSVH